MSKNKWILFVAAVLVIAVVSLVYNLERRYFAYVGLNSGYSTNELIEVDLNAGKISRKKDLSEQFDALRVVEIDLDHMSVFVGGIGGIISLKISNQGFVQKNVLSDGHIMRMKSSLPGDVLYVNKTDRSNDFNTLKISSQTGEILRELKSVIKSSHLFSNDGKFVYEMWPHGKAGDGKPTWYGGVAKISLKTDTPQWVARGVEEIQNRGGYNPGYSLNWPFMAKDPNGNLGIYDRKTAEWEHSIEGVPSPRVVAPNQVIPEKRQVVLTEICGEETETGEKKSCLKVFNWETRKIIKTIDLGVGKPTNVVVRRESFREAFRRKYDFWK